MSWAWLAAAIALEVFATLGLRASDGLRARRWIAPVVVGYAAAFTCLSVALRNGMPVAVAYGIWTAVGIALVALIAHVLWRDPLTRRMSTGIAVIAAGVVLIEAG